MNAIYRAAGLRYRSRDAPNGLHNRLLASLPQAEFDCCTIVASNLREAPRREHPITAPIAAVGSQEIDTLATYDRTGAFLRALELSDADLARSIIGSLNGVDPYQLPGAKGFTSLTRYLIDQTEANRQQLRDELFATTAADFRTFADVMDVVRDRGRIVVMGAEQALTETNRMRGRDWLTLM